MPKQRKGSKSEATKGQREPNLDTKGATTEKKPSAGQSAAVLSTKDVPAETTETILSKNDAPTTKVKKEQNASPNVDEIKTKKTKEKKTKPTKIENAPITNQKESEQLKESVSTPKEQMEEEQAKAQENGSSKIDQKSAKPNEKVTTKQPKRKAKSPKDSKVSKAEKVTTPKNSENGDFVDSKKNKSESRKVDSSKDKVGISTKKNKVKDNLAKMKTVSNVVVKAKKKKGCIIS